MKEKIMSDRTDHRAEAEASCYNDDATKHALLAIIDLLDERLPKPVKNESVYLPGEPVEPGDLRAGDRVSFPWNDEYITCNLVTVHGGSFLRSDAPDSDGFCPDVVSRGCRWAGGITDVRLIERAPREDEDSDEALARVIFGDAYGSHEGLRQAQLDVARAAREHIEAEWKTYILREQAAREKAQDRAAKAEAEVARVTTDLEASRASNDEWIERARRKAAERNAMTDDRNSWEQKASEAEAALADERDRHDATITERDALRERLDALRADLSPGGLVWAVDAALARDDERAAKGGQR